MKQTAKSTAKQEKDIEFYNERRVKLRKNIEGSNQSMITSSTCLFINERIWKRLLLMQGDMKDGLKMKKFKRLMSNVQRLYLRRLKDCNRKYLIFTMKTTRLGENCKHIYKKMEDRKEGQLSYKLQLKDLVHYKMRTKHTKALLKNSKNN